MSEKEKAPRDDVEMYAEGIMSADAPVAAWLKVSYVAWIIIGLVGFVLYWNGSWGWLDRGYWSELQSAADTKFPYTTLKIEEREADLPR
jgi:hypothetical protein